MNTYRNNQELTLVDFQGEPNIPEYIRFFKPKSQNDIPHGVAKYVFDVSDIGGCDDQSPVDYIYLVDGSCSLPIPSNTIISQIAYDRNQNLSYYLKEFVNIINSQAYHPNISADFYNNSLIIYQNLLDEGISTDNFTSNLNVCVQNNSGCLSVSKTSAEFGTNEQICKLNDLYTIPAKPTDYFKLIIDFDRLELPRSPENYQVSIVEYLPNGTEIYLHKLSKLIAIPLGDKMYAGLILKFANIKEGCYQLGIIEPKASEKVTTLAYSNFVNIQEHHCDTLLIKASNSNNDTYPYNENSLFSEQQFRIHAMVSDELQLETNESLYTDAKGHTHRIFSQSKAKNKLTTDYLDEKTHLFLSAVLQHQNIRIHKPGFEKSLKILPFGEYALKEIETNKFNLRQATKEFYIQNLIHQNFL